MIMYPERMQKITITGTKQVFRKVVGEVHSLQSVHLINHVKGDIDIGHPFENADNISRMLVSARSIKAHLNVLGEVKLNNGFEGVGVKNFKELDNTLKNIEKQVQEFLSSRRKIEERIDFLSTRKQELETLSAIELPLDAYTGYTSLKVMVLKLQDLKALEKLKEADVEVVGTNELIAVFVENQKEEAVGKVISEFGMEEISFSSIEGLTGEVGANIRKCEKDLKKLEAEKDKKTADIESYATKWKSFLLLTEKFLELESEKEEAPLMFATSKNAFVITGWVPVKKYVEVKENLSNIAGKDVHIERELIDRKDSIPVKLKNPKAVKPFEFFLEMYSLPNYKEIDPSKILFFTFPLFFGMILGDIGYGLTTAIIFFLLRVKMPSARRLLDVMILSSVSSIIFGFVFGEFFGSTTIGGYHLPVLFHRGDPEFIMPYIIMAILVGVVHVNMGLLLGFINTMRMHGLMHAVTEKASWWFVQGAAVFLGLWFMSKDTTLMIAGGTAGIMGIILLFKGEGIMGIMELPGIFSNILSYSRLMAVGLSSVALAVVINDFAGEFFSKGGFMIIAAVIMLVVGHTINIVLGAFGGFLHSLRLHYVEFFTKFYKGGAEPYHPFGIRE